MCGRFTLTAPPDDVAALLALAELDPFPPRYNIAPTQPILGGFLLVSAAMMVFGVVNLFGIEPIAAAAAAALVN